MMRKTFSVFYFAAPTCDLLFGVSDKNDAMGSRESCDEGLCKLLGGSESKKGKSFPGRT